MLLTAHTDANGIHEVTLVVTDKRGTPIGETTGLTIRSAQVSNVIWLFVGIGCALLFGAIAVRLFRRVRNARRAPQEVEGGRGEGGDRGRADRGEGTRGSGRQVTDRPTDPPTDPPVDEADEQSRLLSNSAVMAAGTTVSRLSGFLRAALLSYALGASVHADIFTVSNTLPNMLYILLAGGVFNAVLVPQLVRALRNDPDRGDAYTNRVVTAAGLFLVVVTIVLVVAAPLIVRLVTHDYHGAVYDSAVAFTRFCLPQVFFYGMFVLVGQILNARGSFGPMMWAPIANNVISVAVILVYLVGYGAAEGAEVKGGFSGGQELLLGLGSTLGIAVQLLILVPYLRRAGFHYRRGSTCAAPGWATPCGSGSGPCSSSSSTRSPTWWSRSWPPAAPWRRRTAPAPPSTPTASSS